MNPAGTTRAGRPPYAADPQSKGLWVSADQSRRGGGCRVGDRVEAVFVHEGNDRVTEPMPSLESGAVLVCVQAGHRCQFGQESARPRGDDVQIHDLP